ncbi:MAG: S8 family serine peptidase [Gemmatimonadales bacterium]|jgi:hypothetical protein
MLTYNRIAGILAAAVVVTACAEEKLPTRPVTSEEWSVVPEGAAPVEPVNTQWSRMSDEELTRAVEDANGRVFIGIKKPGAVRGVNTKGQVIVAAEVIADAKAALLARGLKLEREYRLIPAVVTTIAPQDVRSLRHLPFVDYLEPIFPGRRLTQEIPWGVDSIGAPEAWSEGATGWQVKVLVIDSGIDDDHEDLSIVDAKWCASDSSPPPECPEGDPDDCYGHGTMAAGVIAATNNSVGVKGVSHLVDLYSAKDGDYKNYTDGTICGLEWGDDKGVDVINLSTWDTVSTALTDAIKSVWYNGIFVVGSAGNYGVVEFPAYLHEVIAVGSVDDDYEVAPGSGQGDSLEVVAPGESIYTTYIGGGYTTTGGTSFSAPHVTGVVALMIDKNPDLTNDTIRNFLRRTATDLGPAGFDTTYGYGLVNAWKAAKWAEEILETFEVTATAPELVDSAGTYDLEGNTSDGADNWEWQRKDPGEGWELFASQKDTSVYLDPAAYAGPIQWKLKARRTSDETWDEDYDTTYFPLDVEIDGPTEVLPDDYCLWTADVSGGTGNYTYGWYKYYYYLGSNQYVNVDTGSEGFLLRLYVSDGVSGKWETSYITVTESAEECFNK